MVSLLPRPYPSEPLIEGHFINLELYNPSKHLHDLCSIRLDDPNLEQKYRFLDPHPPKNKKEAEENLTLGWTKYLYVIIDKIGGNKVVGNLVLLSIKPEMGSIETGMYLSYLLEKKSGGTEAVYLILRYVFEELGYRR